MALIEYDLFGEKHDKVQDAIDLLRNLEPEEGYYVAFSGGKDSQCVYHLCQMAGVRFDAHYSVTSVDMPELVQFIKRQYPDAWEGRNHQYTEGGKPYTMWNLIEKKMIPPTRIARYCCDVLKEANGHGRVTVTGVRWDESNNRSKNQGKVTIFNPHKDDIQAMEEMGANFTSTNRGGVLLNNDNGETRDVVEMCYRKRKTIVNPIVSWTEHDVWEFLDGVAKVEHCELYDKGHKRLGCIGCPMNTSNRAAELEEYPKYKAAYLRTFARMLVKRREAGLACKLWNTPEEVMGWWLEKKTDKRIEGQIMLELQEMEEDDG